MVKLSKKMLFAAVAAAALMLVFALMPQGVAAETEDQRLEFIHSLGYEVSGAPEVVNVMIPAEFESVYKAYNNLQKEAGMDLYKYRGKTAAMYTYVMQNYEYSDSVVYLHLLVYRGKVIGGDISSAELNGFMKPLK